MACDIRYNDEILLLRCATTKPFGGFLGLPGGKIETGESIEDAIAREVFEETGIDKRASLREFNWIGARWVRFQNSLDFFYDHFSLSLLEKPKIILSKREHSEHLWIPKQRLDFYRDEMIEDVFETLQEKTWD